MRHHETEGADAVEEEILQHSAWRRRDPPDGVQRRLQLEKGSARSQHERDAADDRGKDVVLAAGRSLQQRLHRHRAFGANQSLDLADDLSSNSFLSEEGSGHRHRDEEDGPYREERVVRQRCAEPHRVVVPPCGDGPAEDAKGYRDDASIRNVASTSRGFARTFECARQVILSASANFGSPKFTAA